MSLLHIKTMKFQKGKKSKKAAVKPISKQISEITEEKPCEEQEEPVDICPKKKICEEEEEEDLNFVKTKRCEVCGSKTKKPFSLTHLKTKRHQKMVAIQKQHN